MDDLAQAIKAAVEEIREEHEDQLWTIAEVANYLNLPFPDTQGRRDTIRKIIDEIPCVRLNGSRQIDRLRWVPSKVRQWARRQLCSPAAAPTEEERYRRV